MTLGERPREGHYQGPWEKGMIMAPGRKDKDRDSRHASLDSRLLILTLKTRKSGKLLVHHETSSPILEWKCIICSTSFVQFYISMPTKRLLDKLKGSSLLPAPKLYNL